MLLGLAAGFTNVGFNWAVTQGDVVRVVLLFYLMPLWIVLLAWIFLGERLTPSALARIALALIGVAVVLWQDSRERERTGRREFPAACPTGSASSQASASL